MSESEKVSGTELLLGGLKCAKLPFEIDAPRVRTEETEVGGGEDWAQAFPICPAGGLVEPKSHFGRCPAVLQEGLADVRGHRDSWVVLIPVQVGIDTAIPVGQRPGGDSNVVEQLGMPSP